VRVLLPLVLLAALAACRRDEITVRTVPKAEDAPQAMPGMGTGAPASRPQGVAWSVPRGWTELPASGMREATIEPPQTHGKVSMTVVALPGGVGGELANVNRWRGQLALPATDEAGAAKVRTRLRTALGEMSVYDMTGPGAKPTRLTAGMIEVKGVTWFFKLMGDDGAVAKAKPAFLQLLKGIHSDAP
jgi:hypothetical protein